jgi:2,4-dienoyl-CoA reductase-like NADH-dependent reductase (Old Yellow Enzyme family)
MLRRRATTPNRCRPEKNAAWGHAAQEILVTKSMHPLLAPLSLRCGVVLSNRLALAPLTNGQSGDDGVVSDDEMRWLLRRARGGFGLVETCAAFVTPTGKGFDGQVGVSDERHDAGLSSWAKQLSSTGVCAVVQLVHGGLRAPSRLTGQTPVAPWGGYTEDTNTDFERARTLSEVEIGVIADQFVAAAERCARAGFGGVELHAAHGYLLSQFLSRTMNPRSDGWGGDLTGRARLLRDLARRVRAACPASFVVGVRLSPEDRGNARGLDLDESVQVAQWLADDGVDFVHLSLWDAANKTTKRPGVHAARLFRDALPPAVAVVAAGGVWSAYDAQRLYDHGADVVAIGRAAIIDPDWPVHVVRDGHEPVRGPRTPAELAAVDVSPRFVRYLRRFPQMVTADEVA